MKDDLLDDKEDAASTNDIVHRLLNSLKLEKRFAYTIGNSVKRLYRKVEESGILNGKTPLAITATMIIIELKKANVDIDTKAIAKLYGVSLATINKIENVINTYLSELEI